MTEFCANESQVELFDPLTADVQGPSGFRAHLEESHVPS
jgi:hypothetical protein